MKPSREPDRLRIPPAQTAAPEPPLTLLRTRPVRRGDRLPPAILLSACSPPAGLPSSTARRRRIAGTTASAASAVKLIQSLPLRADEIRAAGLPEAPADKPALFVDRLIVQKQSPDKPDEVHVWLRVVGFVLRE